MSQNWPALSRNWQCKSMVAVRFLQLPNGLTNFSGHLLLYTSWVSPSMESFLLATMWGRGSHSIHLRFPLEVSSLPFPWKFHGIIFRKFFFWKFYTIYFKYSYILSSSSRPPRPLLFTPNFLFFLSHKNQNKQKHLKKSVTFYCVGWLGLNTGPALPCVWNITLLRKRIFPLPEAISCKSLLG